MGFVNLFLPFVLLVFSLFRHKTNTFTNIGWGCGKWGGRKLLNINNYFVHLFRLTETF